MTAPAYLGRRLVVFAETARCENYDHPVDLVTDGTVFYATGLHAEVEYIGRTGTVLTAACPEPINRTPDHEGDPCPSTVTWDLATEHWTARRSDIEDLETWGDARPDLDRPEQRITVEEPTP